MFPMPSPEGFTYVIMRSGDQGQVSSKTDAWHCQMLLNSAQFSHFPVDSRHKWYASMARHVVLMSACKLEAYTCTSLSGNRERNLQNKAEYYSQPLGNF
jgi:hypothetical protein